VAGPDPVQQVLEPGRSESGAAPVRALPSSVRLRAADRARAARIAQRMGTTLSGVVTAALDALEAQGVPEADHVGQAVAAVRRVATALPDGWRIYVGRLADGSYDVARVPQGTAAHLMAPKPVAHGYFSRAADAIAALEEGEL
jgi:hypothetical protein